MINLLGSYESLLVFGFTFGLRHAIESDHLVAIASLTTESKGLKAATKIGLVWGMGHTLTLFLVGCGVLLLDSVLPENIVTSLQWCVGLMLVLLGLDVLRRTLKPDYRLTKRKTLQQNKALSQHIHESDPKPDDVYMNNHVDKKEFPLRAFIVGLIHGLAGSAALVLLTINTVQSKWMGLSYILTFGLGSIIGMGVLSFIIALPLNKFKNMSNVYYSICLSAGLATIIVGVLLLNEHTQSILALMADRTKY